MGTRPARSTAQDLVSKGLNKNIQVKMERESAVFLLCRTGGGSESGLSSVTLSLSF